MTHVPFTEESAHIILQEQDNGMRVDAIGLSYGLYLGSGKARHFKRILHNVSFYLQPGSLCALMGPSGSGKTSLMDLLSDRTLVGESCGEILFNGAPRSKWLSRDSAYVLQDDLHVGQLTVGESLLFAARVKLPEGTSMEVVNERVQSLLDITGLSVVEHSIVGDSTHKGISGGQLKRLSVAVEIVAEPRLIFLDEPTSGLDSSIALDVMSAIRRITDRNRTCISTIHQPSPSVFAMFDTALLLSHGRLVYFGPAKAVVDYFSSPLLNFPYIPGQNPAEFIIEVCEGVVKPVHRPELPLTADELHACYQQSSLVYKPNAQEIQQLAVIAEVNEYSRLHATTKLTQFKMLMWRNGLSIIRDIEAIKAAIAKSVIVALLIGCVFYQQGVTTTPLFSPEGVPYAEVTNISALLFFGMMHSQITNIEAIPVICSRFWIFRREVDSFAYCVSPYWLSNCISVLPMLFLSYIIFVTISFFLCKFTQTFAYFIYYAGATFMANVTSYYMAMLLGALVKKEGTALVAFPMLFLFFSTFAGFPILLPNIPSFWSWAPTINYIRWCYEGLMVNQWQQYDDEDDSNGSVLALYDFENYNKDYTFIILGGTLFVVAILAYIAMRPPRKHLVHVSKDKLGSLIATTAASIEDDVINPLSGTNSSSSMKKKSSKKSGLEEKLLQQQGKYAFVDEDYHLHEEEKTASSPVIDGAFHLGDVSPSPTAAGSPTRSIGYTLTFKNIGYTVPVIASSTDTTNSSSSSSSSSSSLTILHSVTGCAMPNEVCALMGGSGAGKTTLLDCLAYRKTIGTITGDIMINAHTMRDHAMKMRRLTAYVMQDNVLLPSLTVYENLYFAAKLRLSSSKFTPEQRIKRVYGIMNLLGLTHIAQSLVGSEAERGISGGQKKRLSIGVEVIHLPSIIFLDEPTTGLDSAISYEVMFTVQHLARQNRTIICTIHQPSPQTYSLFDKLLLLGEGRVLYYGDAQQAVGFFSQSPFAFYYLPGSNAAEYVIAVGSGSLLAADNTKVEAEVLAQYYAKSTVCEHWQRLMQEDEMRLVLGGGGQHDDIDTSNSTNDKFRTSLGQQVSALTERMLLRKQREYSQVMLNIAKHVVIAIFYGTIFYHLPTGTDASCYLNRISILFFSLIFVLMAHQADIPEILEDRLLFNRERSSDVVSALSYWLSKLIVDIPFHAVCVLLYCSTLYYLVELRSPAESFFYFFYMLWMTDMIGYFAAQFVAGIAPSSEVAMSFFPILMFFALAFEGYIVYIPQFPDWLQWGTYVDYLRYSFQGMILNEFDGNPNLPLESLYVSELGFNTWNKTQCALILWVFLFGHALASYLVLQYINFVKR